MNNNSLKTLEETSKDLVTSGNPISIIGGIALGVIGVSAFAIYAIIKLNGK